MRISRLSPVHMHLDKEIKYKINFQLLTQISAANSECAYPMTAKRPKHVVDNLCIVYRYRSCTDGNKYNWKYNTTGHNTLFTE
jgi:hypothetical protein